MQILPKIRLKGGSENIGNEIFIAPPDLNENERTFINTDAAVAASSYAVDNGFKFATGEFILVGNIGAEKTEVNRIHTSTSPTSTTITLNSTSSFAHNRGEIITSIPYDQVVIQRSTDSGSTYSDLTTISIRFDSTETYHNHTAGASTDYYRVKFKNSISSDVSTVSDGLIATGYADGTAGYIIRDTLVSLGEKIDGEVLTKEFLFTALHDGRKELDQHQNVERWSFRTAFDYDGGNVIPGQYQISLPSDFRDPDTWKNLLSVRIGTDKLPLIQVDKRRMNDNYRGIALTTLNGAVVTSDTSITLTSSGDFDESGAVSIAAADVTKTLDSVDYTANNESTNVISGVTGIVAAGHATGKNVWQGASFGNPTEYTVYEDKITFSQPFSDELAGENIWLDYYKKMTRADSDGDTLDEPFAEIFKPYLRYRIKLRKNPQLQRETDDDYKSWVEKREAQVAKEFLAQDFRFVPDVPDLR